MRILQVISYGIVTAGMVAIVAVAGAFWYVLGFVGIAILAGWLDYNAPETKAEVTYRRRWRYAIYLEAIGRKNPLD